MRLKQLAIKYLWPDHPDTPYKELTAYAKERVDSLVKLIESETRRNETQT